MDDDEKRRIARVARGAGKERALVSPCCRAAVTLRDYLLWCESCGRSHSALAELEVTK